MVRARDPRTGWYLFGVVTALISGWMVVRHGFAFNDYDIEASAAVARLLDGDVTGFLSAVPSYGGSLVLRGPVIAATGGLGGGEVAAYQAGALLCLLALAIVAARLALAARGRGWSPAACALVVVLAVAGPATTQALEMGHPEELLGAALCVAAGLAALHGRWIPAGLLLGLAVANKPWAIVAVFPVLAGLPARRFSAALLAGGVAVLVMVPLLLGGTIASSTTAVATSAGGLGKPLNVWWFTGAVEADGMASGLPEGTRRPPAWVSATARPLLVVAAALLSLLWLRNRRRLAPESLLGLLALVLLLRCLLDPWTLPYYHLPFVAALLAWEVHSARGVPWAGLAAAAVLQGILALRPVGGYDALAAGYALIAVPAAIALAASVFAWRLPWARPRGAASALT